MIIKLDDVTTYVTGSEIYINTDYIVSIQCTPTDVGKICQVNMASGEIYNISMDSLNKILKMVKKRS